MREKSLSLPQISAMTLADKLKNSIRIVPDFPIPGVMFKDVSTIFLYPDLVAETAKALSAHWQGKGVDKILAIDSRGFLFAPMMAVALDAGMVMVRKKGKLPPETIGTSYTLEYGEAHIEVVKSSIQPGDRVIIHDDLLATGGTAKAAAELACKLGAEVLGFSFVIDLRFLEGYKSLLPIAEDIHAVLVYEN